MHLIVLRLHNQNYVSTTFHFLRTQVVFNIFSVSFQRVFKNFLPVGYQRHQRWKADLTQWTHVVLTHWELGEERIINGWNKKFDLAIK